MSVVAPIATFQGIIPKGREGPTTEVLSTAKVYCDFDCVGPLVRQSGFRETLTNPFDILLSEGLSAEMFFE